MTGNRRTAPDERPHGRNRHRHPLGLPFFLFALAVSFHLHPARASTPCVGLPGSLLQIYNAKALVLEEAPLDGLDRVRPDGDLMSRHTLMLTMSDLITGFNVTHRMEIGRASCRERVCCKV